MNIGIRNAETRVRGGKPFTVYCISVGGHDEPCAERRYTDFVEFHAAIVTANPGEAFPALPAKKWLFNMDKSFILARQAALEDYLRKLVVLFR